MLKGAAYGISGNTPRISGLSGAPPTNKPITGECHGIVKLRKGIVAVSRRYRPSMFRMLHGR